MNIYLNDKYGISQAKFHNFLLQAPVAMSVILGPHFHVAVANKKQLEIWQKDEAEVLHKPIFEIFPELKSHEFNKLLTEVYQTGIAFTGKEIPAQLLRNGTLETAYYDFIYEPLRDEMGEVEGITVVSTDVTEKVLARKQIEAIEQRSNNERQVLYNSFMNAPAGITILKGETHIYEFSNIENNKIAGKKLTIGKTVQENLPELEHQGFIQILNNVFSTGEPFIGNEVPIELKSEDGILEKHYINVAVQPLKDEKGNTDRLITHAVDVTQQVEARKQNEASEAKFRNLILQAPVLITTFRGPSFIVETINEKALELWSKAYGEVINKPLFQVSPELEDGLKTILNYIYTTGEPFISSEIPVQLKRIGKPDTAYFNSVYQPLRDLDNNICGIILIVTEITEAVNARKQIEASGQLSRKIKEELELSIQIGKIGRWYWDLKAETLKWSKEQLDLYGITESEFGGTYNDFIQFIHPLDIAILNPSNDLTKDLDKYEFRIVRRDGKIRWINAIQNKIYNNNNELEAITGVNIDITEQKLAEENLRESENRFRSFIQNSPDMIVQMDKELRHIYVSPHMEKFTDKNAKDFIGKTPREIGFPEEFCVFIDEQISHVKEKKQIHEVEYIGLKGENLLTRVVPEFDESGEVNSFLIVTSDITEREKSEDAIRSLAAHLKLCTESANVGTWSTNMQTLQVEWSGLHNKMWGYDEYRTGITFEDWHKIILPEDTEKAFEKIEEARINHSVYEAEYRIERANDKVIRWMRSFGQYHYNAAGEAVTLTGISLDITEQKDAEHKLRASEELFRTLTLNSPDVISRYDKDGRYLYISPSAVKFTGKNAEESIGKTYREIGIPEVLCLLFDKSIALVLQEKKLHTIEFMSANGYSNISSRLVPEFNETGEAVSVMMIHTDITERKEAENKLRESEERFRYMAETIPQKIFTAMPNGDNDYLNPQWSEFTGLSFEQINKWGWLQFVHPDDREENVRLWKHSLETGEPFKFEHRIRSKDGTYHWHLTYAHALRNESGNIIKWFGSNTDIDKSKKLTHEKFLSEFAEDFSSYKTDEDLFNSIVTYIADKTGLDYVFVGQLIEKSSPSNHEKTFDVKTIALINSGIIQANIVFPLDNSPCQQVIKGANCTFPKGCMQMFPKNETGKKFKVDGYVGTPLLNRKGEAIGVLSVMHKAEIENPGYILALLKIVAKRTEFELERSITANALQVQNEIFKQAEESSLQGSYSFNVKTGKLIYSENLFRLLGFLPNEFEPSTEHFYSLVHPDDRDYINQVSQKLAESKIDDDWHYRVFTKDGRIINIKGTVKFIEGDEEQFIVGTLQDVTEQFLIAKELQEKNLVLEHTNAELSSFTYIASHDLKEPLRKIQMFSNRILENKKFTDETQVYFNRIIAASERMQNLINSLLELSHASVTDLIFRPCNVTEIVEEVKNNMYERILEKGAVIYLDNLPTITGVHAQLEQLFTNLLDNALKYSRHDVVPHIRISYSLMNGNEIDQLQASKQQEYHTIKITDNGIGFDKEYETKIFELFQRLHAKNEYSGTGIGLAICKKIVGNHNGFIKAEAEQGAGATFTFYLPKL